MKILIVMDGYFPGKKYGGPPVSVSNFCSLMKDDCYIVTHNHDKDDKACYVGVESNKWYKNENYSVMYVPDATYNKNFFESVIEDIKPDILYLQGLFQRCIVPCLQLSNKHNIKVVLAPRGELCAGAFKKKYKKIPYIYMLRLSGMLKNVSYQSTSEEETNAIIKNMNADATHIYYLTNIPSIPKSHYSRSEKIKGEGKFVFLSRIHPKKNLISAITFFNNVKGKAIFDIYGPLEDETYWEQCKDQINKLPENIVVNYCGLVSHDDVHEVFSKYDGFVFPTFSENYGHVIAEAMMVGTPVIISDQTPWTDVNEARAGFAYSLSEKNKFEKAIQDIIDMSSEDTFILQNNLEHYLETKIGLEKLRKQYMDSFNRIFRGIQ